MECIDWLQVSGQEQHTAVAELDTTERKQELNLKFD
jgi:hypothetical protein